MKEVGGKGTGKQADARAKQQPKQHDSKSQADTHNRQQAIIPINKLIPTQQATIHQQIPPRKTHHKKQVIQT